LNLSSCGKYYEMRINKRYGMKHKVFTGIEIINLKSVSYLYQKCFILKNMTVKAKIASV
jgi:hypothetical protein